MTTTVMSVLLVDDEPDIRRIGQLALQRVAKWDVRLASSGPEALELAAERAPDLVLLDVMMPGMDGPTTLTNLRALGGLGKTPVIFMTAKVQRHEVDRYLALGAAGVIAKPFDPMSLAKEIQELLASA